VKSKGRSVRPAASAKSVATAKKRRKKMPQLNFTQLLVANQLGFNPISGWQYEYLPWPAHILLLVRAVAVGVNLTMYSGSETIQERSPIQSGGTAGVTPSELNTPAVSFQAAAGDRLKALIDNTTAGTINVDGIIIANPLL